MAGRLADGARLAEAGLGLAALAGFTFAWGLFALLLLIEGFYALAPLWLGDARAGLAVMIWLGPLVPLCLMTRRFMRAVESAAHPIPVTLADHLPRWPWGLGVPAGLLWLAAAAGVVGLAYSLAFGWHQEAAAGRAGVAFELVAGVIRFAGAYASNSLVVIGLGRLTGWRPLYAGFWRWRLAFDVALAIALPLLDG